MLLQVVNAIVVNDKVFKNRFAFVFAGKVVFLALVNQVVSAFVVEALVLLVATSAWFARKPS